jgi:hypothetical protein
MSTARQRDLIRVAFIVLALTRVGGFVSVILWVVIIPRRSLAAP